MQSRKDMKSFVKSLRHPRRFSILRTLLAATGLLVILEAITVIVLQVVSAQRKHHRQEGSFPHPELDEVPLEENILHLYD